MPKRSSMSIHFRSASMSNFYTYSNGVLPPEFHIFHCHPRIPMPVVLRTSYHLVSRLIRTNDPTFPFVHSICCLLVPMAQRSQRSIMRLSWSNSGKTTERDWLSHLRHRGFWCCPTWPIRVRILDFLVVYFLPGPAVLTGAFVWAVFSEDAIAGSRCMLLAGCFGWGLEWWIHWESQSSVYLFISVLWNRLRGNWGLIVACWLVDLKRSLRAGSMVRCITAILLQRPQRNLK